MVDRSAVDRAYDSLGKPGKPQAFPGSEDIRTAPWIWWWQEVFFFRFLGPPFFSFHTLISDAGIRSIPKASPSLKISGLDVIILETMSSEYMNVFYSSLSW